MTTIIWIRSNANEDGSFSSTLPSNIFCTRSLNLKWNVKFAVHGTVHLPRKTFCVLLKTLWYLILLRYFEAFCFIIWKIKYPACLIDKRNEPLVQINSSQRKTGAPCPIFATKKQNLTLYTLCIILQYVYEPTWCTAVLWLDFFF